MATLKTNHGSTNNAVLPFQAHYDVEIKHREHIMAQFAARPDVKDSLLPHLAGVVNDADSAVIALIEANIGGFSVVGKQLMFQNQPFDIHQLLGVSGNPGTPIQLGNPGTAPTQLGNPGTSQLSADDAQLLAAAKGWRTGSGLSVQDFIQTESGYYASMRQMNPAEQTNIRRFMARLLRKELQFVSGNSGTLEVEVRADRYDDVKDVYTTIQNAAGNNRSRFDQLVQAILAFLQSGGSVVPAQHLTDANNRITALRQFVKDLNDRLRDVKISTGRLSTVDAKVIALTGVPNVPNASATVLEKLADPTKINP